VYAGLFKSRLTELPENASWNDIVTDANSRMEHLHIMRLEQDITLTNFFQNFFCGTVYLATL